MDEIDKLLANLNPSPTPPAANPDPSAANSSKSSIDDLLSQIGASQPQVSQPVVPPPERLFEEMKVEHEQQQAELKRQAELEHRKKQQRLEQLKQQQRAELAEKAAQWLKFLNPKSSEGRWFEEFACNYSSRLEAAIDYLEALQDITPSSD